MNSYYVVSRASLKRKHDVYGPASAEEVREYVEKLVDWKQARLVDGLDEKEFSILLGIQVEMRGGFLWLP